MKTAEEYDAIEERALNKLLHTCAKIVQTRPTCEEDSLWYELKSALNKFEAARNGND